MSTVAFLHRSTHWTRYDRLHNAQDPWVMRYKVVDVATFRLFLVRQIRIIDRKQEVPHDGAMCDLMWSDPEGNVTLVRILSC